MAVSKLLGFDLCPRLRNLSEQKLYLPRRVAAPDGLASVLAYEISIKAIRDGWEELLRLVASIHSGRVSANVALQRFGSAAQGDPVYRAADHLGGLLRTLFLCDYFSNVEFRREMHTLLDRGESVHQLQRAIYTGKIAPERGRRRDEMIPISRLADIADQPGDCVEYAAHADPRLMTGNAKDRGLTTTGCGGWGRRTSRISAGR
jgi:TnpA family transposase